MTILTFALKRCFRSVFNLILLGATPLLILYMAQENWYILPMGYQLYGLFLMMVASKLVSIMMEDRTSGVLKRIGVAPVTYFQYLWQNLLAFSILLIAQCAVVVAGGMAIGLALPKPLLLFVIFSFFAMSSIALSLAWFSLFRNRETAFTVFIFLVVLFAMVGGMFWPIEIMPHVFQRLAMLLPTYWMTESLLLVTGENVTTLWLPLALLLLFTLVFLIIGSKRRII